MLLASRDHNATSYSTETNVSQFVNASKNAEIITLRAIALKLHGQSLFGDFLLFAEIITLRAIALKRKVRG